MKQLTFSGVILAAGKGTRMIPFSSQYPKTLLPICNKAQILYQIDIMKKLGIKDIIIVIGHLGYEIVRHLTKANIPDVNIRYVEQEEMLGIAHALGKIERYVSNPFLMFLGDIFFVPDRLERIFEPLRSGEANAVLAVKLEEDPDMIKKNFSITLNQEGFAVRVIEKPRYIQNDMKGCGLYLFDLPIFDAIRSTPRTAMRNEYEITHSIQILIDDGMPVKVEKVVAYDMNLTTPADVLVCNLHQLRAMGHEKLIGENVRVHPGAEITNAVIGDNVEITEPVRISNSVVFENTKVNKNLDFVIQTPRQIIDCKLHM